MAETTCYQLQLQFVPGASERPCTIHSRSLLWKRVSVSFRKGGKKKNIFLHVLQIPLQ